MKHHRGGGMKQPEGDPPAPGGRRRELRDPREILRVRGLWALGPVLSDHSTLQEALVWGNKFDSAACRAWLPAMERLVRPARVELAPPDPRARALLPARPTRIRRFSSSHPSPQVLDFSVQEVEGAYTCVRA